MRWKVFSKDGQTERCVINGLEYSDSFMSERVVTSTVTSETELGFEVFDYIDYRGERFEMELLPTVKKVSSREYRYDLRFVSLKYEMERCTMRDIVPHDNGIVYPTPISVEFTGSVRHLVERIQACMDDMYGKGVWSFTVADGVESEEKSISISNQNCWNALSLVNTEYNLNYFIKGRSVRIGGDEPVIDYVFRYGKGNGLYEIERLSDTDTGVVTKLRAYGGTRNLDYSYPKKPDWEDSVLPANYALSPLRLMLPSFKTDGKTDYVLASEEAIAKYGIREGVITYDDIYPSIEGATNASGQATDVIKGVEAVTSDTQPTFTVYLYDLGFDLGESLTTQEAQLSMKTGALQGYAFNITKIDRLVDGSYKLELGRNTLEEGDTGNFTVPNPDWNMSAGDKFVLLNISMPQKYVRDAESRLLSRAKEYLAEYSKTNYSYNIGIDEIFMARHRSLYEDIMAGKRLTVSDVETGINNQNIIIQSLTIKEGEGMIPTFSVTLNDKPSASTLDRIQGQIGNIESTVNSKFSSQSELLRQYRNKLDKSVWDSVFKIHKDNPDDDSEITSLESLVGVWTEKFLSVKGLNPESGGSGGGATTLGGLVNVGSWADELPSADRIMVQRKGATHWESLGLDDIGLNEAELADYLTTNDYAKKSDMPSLTGYATEKWVTDKGYITSAALSGYATQSWVSTQLGSYATSSALKTVSDRLEDFLTGSDTDNIINKWKELEGFLSGMAESDRLSVLLGNKADKTVTFTAGAGLAGGGSLAANRTISLLPATAATLGGVKVGDRLRIDENGVLDATYTYTLPTASASVLGGVKVGTTLNMASSGVLDIKAVGKAGTYFKVTTDAYGRVTSGMNPTTLSGFGITDGVNDFSLAGTGNAVTGASVSGHVLTLTRGATFLTKAAFDDLFEKVNIGTSSAPVYAVRVKYGLYTEDFLSAKGPNPGDGGGGNGTIYDRLDAWADYDASKAGWILSAGLGNDLNTRVASLEGGSAVTVTQAGSGSAVTGVTKSGKIITVMKGNPAFGSLTGKPTTLTGYGITDAYTKTQADSRYVTALGTSGNYLTWTKNGTTSNMTVPFSTASGRLTYGQLTSQNLNDYLYASYSGKGYYAGGGHTVANNPGGEGVGFGLQVWRIASGYTGHLAMLASGVLKTRYNDGTSWGAWRTMLDSLNYNTYAPTKTGGGASGTWGISITGSAAKLGGLLPAAYDYAKAYNFTNGCLVATDIAATTNAMVSVHITGNGYNTQTTIDTTVQFYNYNTDNAIYYGSARNNGLDFGNISVFNYNGKVYLWFKQANTFQTFYVYVRSGSVGNRVTSITNAAKPTTGVTREVSIDPSNVALVTGNVASASKLAAARTINGTSFDGTANIVTSYWGTSRTFTLGAASKSVNGGANVSFSRSEMNVAYGRETSYSGTTAASGWYRIAYSSSGIGNNYGIFTVTAVASGFHTALTLSAGTSYGNTAGTSLVQLSCSHYNNAQITNARIVYHTSYAGNYAYLEIQVNAAISTVFYVKVTGGMGWNLYSSLTAGSIPSGYSSKSLALGNDSVRATSFVGALTGNASSATRLATARSIFGKSFDGTGNVAGQALVYGSYNATAGTRYATGALQIREAGLVGSTQTDDAYAPAIGFHWGSRSAASLIYTTSGFKFMSGSFASYSPVYAGNLVSSGTVQGTQLKSTTGTGTAPLAVSSATMVTNLNAEMVGGVRASNIPLEYDADYTPSGTSARWIRIAHFNYSNAIGSWSGTFAISNDYYNNENQGVIFNVTTRHTSTSAANKPVITQTGGGGGLFTAVRIVKDTSTTYANMYLEVYYNSTSASNIVHISYKPANRSRNRWTLYTTYTAGSVPANHTEIVRLNTGYGLATTDNVSAQGIVTAAGSIYANGGYLKSTLSGNTIQIGSQNGSWAHFQSTLQFYFNTHVCVNGNHYPYTNNAFTSGSSSKRWSNVYATAGNFSSHIDIGSVRISYDVANNALKISKTDGTAAGLYSTGFLSTKGLNSGDGGSEGGGLVQSVYGYSSLGKTFSDTTLTDTFNAYTISRLAGRITTLESGSALTVNPAGSGNAVTSVTKLGNVITVTKGATFLTAHQSLANYMTLNTAQTITATKTWSAHQNMGNSSINRVNSASGGNATGSFWYTNGYAAVQAGIGCITTANASPRLYMGWGISPWIFDTSFSVSASGITYKGNAVLHAANYNSYAPTKTGGGASGTWGINVTGNAATAGKWATARTVTLTGATTGSVSIDGSGNATLGTANQYLNGYYISGGHEKPNYSYFGSAKLRLQMLNAGSNMGLSGWSWADVLYMSSYGGGDVKGSHALVLGKNNAGIREMYIFYQNYDAAEWDDSPARVVTHLNFTSIVNKIGTATVGSGTRHIYLSAGVPTASSSTVGSAALPVYMNAGTVTACSTTLGVSITGNAATATQLATERTIWGQKFRGAGNVSGSMSGVGHVLFSANATYSVGTEANNAAAAFVRSVKSNSTLYLGSASGTSTIVRIGTTEIARFSRPDGYLGLGTGSPTERLHVVGNIKATGNIYTRYINSDTSRDENADASQIITTNASDNFYRKSSVYQVSRVLNTKTRTLDLRSLDAGKWYPCHAVLSTQHPSTVKIWSSLLGNKPSWATHASGFTLNLVWRVTASGWGATSPQRQIYNSYYAYAPSNPCGGIEQNTMGSAEIVYLRGGALYYYMIDTGETFTINSSGYSWTSGDYTYSAPVRTSVKADPIRCYDGSILSATSVYCYGLSATGPVTLGSTLSVAGALSASATVNIAGVLNANNATDAASTTSASLVCDGGVGIVKQLRVGGYVYLGNALVMPYVGGTWLSLATRTDIIQGNVIQSTGSAHGLFRVKSNAGHAVTFGGLNNTVGFYGTFKATADAGTNRTDWNTTWDAATGNLTHSKALTVGGAATFSSTLSVSNTSSPTVSSTAASIKTSGGLYVAKVIWADVGIFSNGYMSAKGLNTASDMRLKNRVRDIYVPIRAIAEAPAFEYTWKDGTPGVMVGSSAQYWEKVAEHCVTKGQDGYLSMRYGQIALVSCISVAREMLKESLRIDALEREVERLKRENEKLKEFKNKVERRFSA